MKKIKKVIIAEIINTAIIVVMFYALKYKTLKQLSFLLCCDGSIIMFAGVFNIIRKPIALHDDSYVFFPEGSSKQIDKLVKSDYIKYKDKSIVFFLCCFFTGLIPFLVGIIIGFRI